MSGWRAWRLPAWLFFLAALYPVPHTIALRNLLIAGGLAALGWRLRRADARARLTGALRAGGTTVMLALALSAWMPLQSWTLGRFAEQSLALWAGDWLVAGLIGLAGFGLAATDNSDGRPGRRLATALLLAMAAHLAALLVYQGAVWLKTGAFPWGDTPLAALYGISSIGGGRDHYSGLAVGSLALLAADLLARGDGHGPLLALPSRAVAALAALALAATLTLSTRNGVLVALLLLLVLLAALARRRRWLASPGRRLLPAAALAAIALFGLLAVKLDPRWSTFRETVAIALNTGTHKYWLDYEKYPAPRLASGEPVEPSAYLRIAWAKVATERLAAHPLGLGYGHPAFGWAVAEGYGEPTEMESSHSGMLDFALANGLPGLLLWLALAAVLIREGWRRPPVGLALAFFTLAYFARGVVDSHFSGYRLELAALTVGVLLAAALTEQRR